MIIVKMWLGTSVISCYNSTILLHRTYHGEYNKIFTAPFVYIGPINIDFIIEPLAVPSTAVHHFIRGSYNNR